MFVSRTRFYSTWYKGKVVHEAHQGIHTLQDRTETIDTILRANIEARSPVVVDVLNMSLSKIRDVLDGVSSMFSEPIYDYGKISFHRDYKRQYEPVTEQSLDNPFTADTWTKPHRVIKDAYRWEQITRDLKLTLSDKVRLLSDPRLPIIRRGRLTKKEVKERIEEQVRRLKSEDKTEREIAEELKMSQMTVHRRLVALRDSKTTILESKRA